MKNISKIMTSITTAAIFSIAVLTGQAFASDSQHMYRLYNPNSGEHFYTANIAERDATIAAGWNDEGLAWDAPVKSNTPVYRLYSGTDHHYTMSSTERDHLVSVGWSYEGIGWYSDDAKTVPLYRQYNPNVVPSAPTNNSGSHNYTTSKAENDLLVKVGWHEEGIGWYGCVSNHKHVFNIPVYKTVTKEIMVCSGCGAPNPSPSHIENHALKGESGSTVSSVVSEQVPNGYKCSCGATQ